jgi:hypothetical protein
MHHPVSHIAISSRKPQTRTPCRLPEGSEYIDLVGLDPIEPPPQGDVELGYVRERYGDQLVLFGNIEASDIENLPSDKFRRKVDQALQEGTAGNGRGLVLMPSACSYGRYLSPLAVENYCAMIEATENF